VPDTAEYLSRIREYAEGRNPLELQAQAPVLLAELISGVSPQQLTTRPQPDKWSVGEILAHLAEDEIATAWRYRQMVEHSGIELAGFDQDLWARLGNYRDRTPSESLTLFQLLRQSNLAFLQQLAPEQFDCFGIHAERGRITVRDLAAHMAGHDGNHIEQIRRILQRAA
jgi:DinB family protein